MFKRTHCGRTVKSDVFRDKEEALEAQGEGMLKIIARRGSRQQYTVGPLNGLV